MKKLVLLGILVSISAVALGQLERDVMGQNDSFATGNSRFQGSPGEVVVFAHPHLNYLLNRYVKSKQEQAGIPGWRIQIFFGSGHGAADRARKTKKKFEEKYNMKAYLLYQSPYFKVRVGDFRLNDKSQAIRSKERIIKDYPNCWIVEDIVNAGTKLKPGKSE